MTFRLLLLSVLFTVATNSADAGLVISYSGTTVQAGTVGTIDVLVSSDATLLNPDNLNSFSTEFLIEPVLGANANSLKFSLAQGDSQITDGNFVFFGDSQVAANPPMGVVLQLNAPQDNYIGGDATVSNTGIDLHAGLGGFLLYRFELDATLGQVGEQFTLSLRNNPVTSFLDKNAIDLSLTGSSFNPHLITLSAVPEPGSAALLSAALIASAWARRARIKRPAK